MFWIKKPQSTIKPGLNSECSIYKRVNLQSTSEAKNCHGFCSSYCLITLAMDFHCCSHRRWEMCGRREATIFTKMCYFWTRQAPSSVKPGDLHSFSTGSYDAEGEKTKTTQENSTAGGNSSTSAGWDRTPSKGGSHNYRQLLRTGHRSCTQTTHQKAFLNSITNLKPNPTTAEWHKETEETIAMFQDFMLQGIC